MLRVILLFISLAIMPAVMADNSVNTKKERNLISQGNECYVDGNYKNAVEFYRKALDVNPLSLQAEFNLASALINLSEKDYDKKNAKPIDEATSLLKQLVGANNKNVVIKSLYNLGNISYNNNDYASSIDYYKKVLRLDPNNDKARTYLRMAQLKNNQNQNKEDKQQYKEQNKKEENKQQEQEQEQNNNNQPQNNQQQNNNEVNDTQENINDASAERILKSIENKEQETLMRIHQRKKNAQHSDRKASGHYIEKPW